mmetsp:Transcript_63895/g.161922  ORF Transcript_63895/g.161922 Transcript_63895/m.161922 type:complete len:280 (-) Transcript_63895:976-1815(-)
MLRASDTAAKPSLACFMVSRFSSFSVALSSVVSLRFFLKVSTSEVNSSISSLSSMSWISKACTSTSNFRVSANRYVLSWLALPSSVSQKPFLVASLVASAIRRSTSCWIKVLTLRNGSAARCAASWDSAELPKRWPSFFSTETTLSWSACDVSAEVPRSSAADRPPALRLARASWTKATAATGAPPPAEGACFATVLRLGCSCLGATTCAEWLALVIPEAFFSRKRARLLTEVSKPEAFDVKMSNAPVSAVSSSLRNAERWSQSLALVSHRSVKSFMYS